MNSQVRYIEPSANEANYRADFAGYSMVVAGSHRWASAAAVGGLAVMSCRCPTLVMCVFMLLVAGGCDQGAQRVPVSGQVLIDGEPLTMGTIRFVPASGRPASSLIAADGSFRVAAKSLSSGEVEVVGLVPGSYRIAVSAAESLGDAEDADVRWLVPRHYGDFRTSGLEADIQMPTESLIVELTWEGAQETNEKARTEESSVGEEDRNALEKRKGDG